MAAQLLLIEDDEVAAYLTLKLLKSCGFGAEVDIVRDGVEAMEYLACEGRYTERKTGNPSLILLDLKLPHLDGFEVLKQVRTDPKFSSIPIFILSASASDEDIHRSSLLGVSKYIVKPLKPDDIKADLGQLV
ncbi:response regulator [Noviherbaspirillum aerium]|uniref:response regulator n=1 Tax=Noviherbaspirillum aerium TaxID=2588497 RepID=UPI00124F2DFB|nr:response regulator [Noviherbaspirillum aerium]